MYEYIPMIVAVNEGKPTLLGGNWLKLKIDWNRVFNLNETSTNEEL